MSGWCLARLRTTCTLWAFVRSGIIEKIWEEEILIPPASPSIPNQASGEKPALPPRKRGLWGIASAIGERAASWSEGDKDKIKKAPPLHPQEPRRLPPMPPSHPPVAATPPPLPKRNEDRSRNPPTNPSPLPRTSIENGTNTNALASTTVPSSSVPTPPPVQGIPVHVRSSSSEFTALPPRSPKRTSLPDRVHTPSNVPLPESRPPTPPAIPPRTKSPVVIGNGGAPPPLPRRAAARGVRSTATVSASRPSTPVTGLEGTAVAHTPSAAEKISAEPTTKVDEKVNGKLDGNDDSGEPADAGNKILDRVIQSRSPIPDIFWNASSSKSEDAPNTEGLEPEKGAETDEEDNKARPNAVNGLDSPDKVKTDGEIKNNRIHHEHINGVVEDDKVDSKAQALEIEETDKRQYVSEGTWEEKTWKELVKLREDMFWARVGGFRG